MILFSCHEASTKQDFLDQFTEQKEELSLRINQLKRESEKLSGDSQREVKRAMAKIEKERRHLERVISKVEKSTIQELQQSQKDLEDEFTRSTEEIEKWLESALKKK